MLLLGLFLLALLVVSVTAGIVALLAWTTFVWIREWRRTRGAFERFAVATVLAIDLTIVSGVFLAIGQRA